MSELPACKPAPATKITVLISGKGSNLGKLIEAIQSGLLAPHRIIRVISNRKDALGLDLARAAGFPTEYHNLIAGKYYKSGETNEELIRVGRKRYDAKLAELILKDGPDLVVCGKERCSCLLIDSTTDCDVTAGWMHILTPEFLDPLATAKPSVPVINLHPALPGEYDGKAAIERAWNDFQNGKLKSGRTGVMVHYVINEVDRGLPIVTREIPCIEGESLEDLTERVHSIEHQIIVEGTGLAIIQLWEQRRAAGMSQS